MICANCKADRTGGTMIGEVFYCAICFSPTAAAQLSPEQLKQRIAELEAQLAERQRTCDGSCDIALARRQVGPDGYVPGNARECAEMWEREASRLDGERQRLKRELAEWKAGSNAEAKAGDEARAKVKELERSLLLAYDTIRKGDLARQNAGGMEMQIQELERENGELQQEHDFLMKWFEKHGTKAHHSVFEVFDNVEVERDQLRLQVVRLREALGMFQPYTCHYHAAPCAYCDVLSKALSETTTQSAKEVIGPTVELLEELKPCIVSWSRDTLIEKLLKEIARLKRLLE